MIFNGRDIGMLERSYANHFKILQKDFEFLLDLGKYYPENDQAELHTRIITNPFYASEPFITLKGANDRSEEKLGSIRTKIQEVNDMDPSSKP